MCNFWVPGLLVPDVMGSGHGLTLTLLDNVGTHLSGSLPRVGYSLMNTPSSESEVLPFLCVKIQRKFISVLKKDLGRLS